MSVATDVIFSSAEQDLLGQIISVSRAAPSEIYVCQSKLSNDQGFRVGYGNNLCNSFC